MLRTPTWFTNQAVDEIAEDAQDYDLMRSDLVIKMSGLQRKHNYASLTVKEALSKLLTMLETIELRKGLKPHEKKRA
ncbi:hypothetical protein BJX99DRAFT_263211 [Aspergillus californicus]